MDSHQDVLDVESSDAGADSRGNGHKGVPSVRSAVAVLRYLHDRGNEPATMSQVARTLEMNGSTCFNILKTLEHERILNYDAATKTYELSHHLVELASVVDDHGHVVKVALQHATALVGEMELACLLVCRTDNDEFLVVDKVESSKPIKVTVAQGQRFPANSAVLAKAYYAWQPDEVVNDLLEQHGLPAYSVASITDIDVFKQVLEEVRVNGFAESRGEYWPDHNAIAAPIFGRDGRILYLFVTVGFVFELTDPVMQDYGRQLREAADRVTADIGGRRPPDPSDRHASDRNQSASNQPNRARIT